MTEHVGMEIVFGVSQLFVKRNTCEDIQLLIAKVTDDFLLGGMNSEMENFTEMLRQRFDVGKVIIDNKLHLDGCEIAQSNTGDITMSMNRYLERLVPIELSRARRKQRNETATESKVKQYR